MSEFCHVNLNPVVTKEEPDIRFTDNLGDYLDIMSINLDQNGKISSVLVRDSRNEDFPQLLREDFQFDKEFLFVPGVGALPPGVVVRHKGSDYLLLFGWHTNVSNQTLYSWFLSPVGKFDDCDSLRESPVNKTVYREMIDEIDLIHFR